MKREIITLLALCCLNTAAISQVNYGVKGGVNLGKSSYSEANFKDYQTNNVSFYITGYGEFSIAKNTALQPGISLQGKGDKYKFDKNNLDGSVTWSTMSIEIPVNAIYYIPTGISGSFFLGAGPYIGFNVSGKQKAKGNIDNWVSNGSKNLKFTGSKRDMNLIDAGLNFLGGYKLNNGLLVNVGYGLGLSNLSPSDDSDRKLSNRTFSFGIGYQL